MKTQVLIPAQNEANRLPALLNRLSSDVFDVHIAVNASNDGTADVARRYTDSVYEFEQPGKLPAMQGVLKLLGESALAPLLMLDADTRPIKPQRWNTRMVGALRAGSDIPTVVSAPIVFAADKAAIVDPIVRSIVRYADTARSVGVAKRQPLRGAQYGPNMGLHLATKKTLDDILDLPHIWPMEDVAIVKTVVDSHPEAEFRQLIQPDVTAFTDRSDSMQPLLDWVLHPQATRAAEFDAYRLARPAGNQISFDDWLKTKQ